MIINETMTERRAAVFVVSGIRFPSVKSADIIEQVLMLKHLIVYKPDDATQVYVPVTELSAQQIADNVSEADIRSFRNAGRKTVEEIIETLSNLGAKTIQMRTPKPEHRRCPTCGHCLKNSNQ